ALPMPRAPRRTDAAETPLPHHPFTVRPADPLAPLRLVCPLRAVALSGRLCLGLGPQSPRLAVRAGNLGAAGQQDARRTGGAGGRAPGAGAVPLRAASGSPPPRAQGPRATRPVRRPTRHLG